MAKIVDNLSILEKKIAIAVKKARREEKPLVLLVSKKQSILSIKKALECGYRHFGESYVQEAISKIQMLENNNIIWHFIGPIQSNKVKSIARYFTWVHSIDRIKIVQKLNHALKIQHMQPINICIQVNISQEPSKSGVMLDNVYDFIQEAVQYDYIRIRGIMVIPQYSEHKAQQRAIFQKVFDIFQQLQITYPFLDTLSMGMSNDFESAIEMGSTLLRIGSRVFGERK